MQFGLFGGAKTSKAGAVGDSQAYDDFVRYVVRADELNYAGAFLVEHHFTGLGQISASLNLLAFLAARTSSIRLGTAVIVLPWHNPVLLAEQVATIDLLSGGRVDFGVGKGYRQSEFGGFCIPIEEATERFDEAMEIIRKAWSEPERFSHQGKRWCYNNIVVEPAPSQRPHPPFWMGAGSEESIRRAAREGYNLLLDQVGSINLTIERVTAFREECELIGRPYSPMMVGVTRGLHHLRSESDRDAALALRREVLKSVGGIAKGRDAAQYADPTNISDELVREDDAPLLGTSEEIVERLKKLQDGGVGYILLSDPQASEETLERFASEVMPAFTTEKQRMST